MTVKTNVELMKFESNVQFIKYQVLKDVTKLAMKGTLGKKHKELIDNIIEDHKVVTRCCIYKEKEVVKERIKLAMGGDKKNKNIIEVLPAACDACPVNRFTVTEACRGCLAHKCYESCPVNAISYVENRAYINSKICIECGKCKAACPYDAISDVRRPCVASCNAGAISINYDKKAVIDNAKCVQCGSCVFRCPFGAIMDKSYTVDVIKLLRAKKQKPNMKIYAVIAPAIASQFPCNGVGQVVSAIKKLGFHHVIEAALGADMIALHETKEFAEAIGEKKVITSSCCPSFLSYIEINYPELKDNISNSVSPMIAISRLVKKMEPNAKVVFIGPCIGKKAEIQKTRLRKSVDYVITFEELLAMLDAADIQVNECEEDVLDNASFYGRIFARSGGLTEAIKHVIQSENLKVDFNPVTCNGLKECDMALKLAKIGRSKGNFIEGMACVGGCIGGPSSLRHGPKDIKAVDDYGKLAMESTIKDSTKIFEEYDINLNR